ncbi:unnamed protein product [Amoebophrya sp. A120]|nr:unnamed protein product [Amoebophrya sp. A120]|eukprot:GSA120T00004813001.1
MVSLQFVETPIGDGLGLEMAKLPGDDEGDALLVAQRKVEAVADARCSKVVFVENIPSVQDQGRFFEFKVEACLTGFIPGLAVGFSSVDPTGDGFPVPRRACELDETVMIGYVGKVYADSGNKSFPIKWNPGRSVVARGHDRIGCLLTPKGEIVVFQNKEEVVRWSSKKDKVDISGLMNTDKLYGVVDVYGGTQRIKLNPAANIVSPTDDPEDGAEEEGG